MADLKAVFLPAKIKVSHRAKRCATSICFAACLCMLVLCAGTRSMAQTGELGSFNFDGANPTSGLVATGAPAISTLNNHTPPNSLSFPAGNNYETYTLSSATSVLYTRQYMEISSIGSNSNAFLRLYHSGNELMSFFLSASTGNPSYFNQAANTTTTISATAVSTGSIHLVELYIKMSATAGQVICKIDGATVYTSAATLNTGTSTVDTVWFGQIGNTAPAGWGTTYMDNVDFSAINWIGPIAVSSGSGTGELGSFSFDGANPTGGLVATGAPAISTLNNHTPPNSLSFPAGNNYETYTLSSATSALYTRQYIDISSIGSNANTFLRLYHGGSQLTVFFLNPTSGNPSYYNQATSTTTTISATALSTGRIHLVELYIKMSATAGQIICKIDGATVYTSAATLNTGTSTIDTVRFGQIGDTAPVGWGTTYMDNVDFSAVNWIGPTAVTQPQGQGTLPSNLSVTCSPTTLLAPQSTTCTALIPVGATGTVTFSDWSGAEAVIPVDRGGEATAVDLYAGWPAGSFSMTASYSGDQNYASSSNSTTITVNTGTTTPNLSLTCSPIAMSTPQAATCQAQVHAGATGFVTFNFAGAEYLTPINASGVATFSSPFIGAPQGTYSISAVYGGDQTYGRGVSNAQVAINASTPTTASLPSNLTLTCTPSTITPPQRVVCRAQLAYGATGSVVFGSPGMGNQSIPVTSLSEATLPNLFSSATNGSYTVTASYAGNQAYAGSSASATITVTTGTAPADLSASCFPAVISSAQSTTCMAHAPAEGVQGWVAFSFPTKTLFAQIDATGTATVSNVMKNTTPGTYSIAASWGGDNTYGVSVSNATVTVQQQTPATEILLSCTPNPTGATGQLTCVAQLPEGATGSVDFSISGEVFGSATIDNQGKATLTVGFGSSPGSVTITASYAGDSVYGPGTATFLETVTAGTPIYSYSITDANGNPGYDGVSNVTSFFDSVMGQWTMGATGYDNLNRLVAASVSGGPYDGMSMAWNIDSFGNRSTQLTSVHIPPQSTPGLTFNNAKNRADQFVYDNGGNVTNDGINAYLYDGDNRICAVNSSGTLTGYLYDADGRRVAKGTLTSFSCDLSVNGFTATERYTLGQGGEQLMAVNGSGSWERTSVFTGGKLLGTFDAGSDGFHYAFSDWLGTKRAQYSLPHGVESLCSSLPYGDSLNCTGSDATNHHFTGKERDAESNNDYFGARYYGSGLGRFLSPDPSRLSIMPSNPQTWNRYAYVYNNPLSLRDDNGKWPTQIHNQIIDKAFPNLTPAQRQILKNVSAHQDNPIFGGWANGNSYQHAMRAPNQTVEQAQSQFNGFVAQNVNYAQNEQLAFWVADPDNFQLDNLSEDSLEAFGEALHAVLDSTSPTHAGFQEWNWMNLQNDRRHVQGEANINDEQMQRAVMAARSLFNRTYGYLLGPIDNSSVTTIQGEGTVRCGAGTVTVCPSAIVP